VLKPQVSTKVNSNKNELLLQDICLDTCVNVPFHECTLLTEHKSCFQIDTHISPT
jgi:hypothetical protein